MSVECPLTDSSSDVRFRILESLEGFADAETNGVAGVDGLVAGDEASRNLLLAGRQELGGLNGVGKEEPGACCN